MDVRIGVIYAHRELSLDMEGTVDEVAAQVDEALSGGGSLVWLSDKNGTRVGVPLDKLAYVEIEGRDRERPVGFGSGE